MAAQVPLSSSGSLSKVDILILGAGWLSQFLLPALDNSSISYASTTRSANISHYPEIPSSSPPNLTFAYDQNAPLSAVSDQFRELPKAKTVVVTFPINEEGASEKLLRGYGEVHGFEEEVMWVQLGSTGVWQLEEGQTSQTFNRSSPISPTNARGKAENELLSLNIPHNSQVVLNLAGLWGGERNPRNWVGKVLPTKEALRKKGGLHMIHGEDVSAALILVHNCPSLLPPFSSSSPSNRRFIMTDTRVYDWWDLASWWGSNGQTDKEATWVRELMQEEDVKTLPREAGALGRVLDGRDFWELFKGAPMKRLQ